ncbi:DUF3482 domain-containing protein [Undibacterium sp.]|jgi:hypothetical protein|uniref:DUF3482 domain-containing protein n=1 Tax=Undibacterium sp. TaxID=1914977 RepID=UPI002C5BBC6D|nr:DUF3482 domain-containing protein [Undibacterium sp.]HTD04422.1 DUF3482 domain-containing protein [Undibacterium sp.]
MSNAAARIQLALISHTNVGKTTLARTLTGMDVGEVRDAPHVTTIAESHPLLSTAAGDQLLLWDTPGFGDSVRLFKRLNMSGNPVGWFLREVVDKYHDRPFWLSQLAFKTAQESADIVLYLVNSSEDPHDTGYLAPEMKILQWLGKPVVVLLNQMGPPRPAAEELAEQLRWEQCLAGYQVVQKIIALDAFARCWVHERVFYEALAGLLPDAKKGAYARLAAAWSSNNATRFAEAMRLSSQQIITAAQDSQPIANEESFLRSTMLKVAGLDKKRRQKRHDAAMNVLLSRLNVSLNQKTADLLKLHQLDPGAALKINERVREHFVVRAPIDAKQAGLLGALISGAATGLSADLMAGGLTLGGGALVGGVVGALTFAGVAWGFNEKTDNTQTRVQFADEFLRSLLVASLLRYLAIAHFGRGRGNFVEGEAPAFWQAEVEQEVAQHEQQLAALWPMLRNENSRDAASAELNAAVRRMADSILQKLYPAPVR